MNDKCPVCGCEEYALIYECSPNNHNYLIIAGYDSVYLNACKNCGNIYLARHVVKELNKRNK